MSPAMLITPVLSTDTAPISVPMAPKVISPLPASKSTPVVAPSAVPLIVVTVRSPSSVERAKSAVLTSSIPVSYTHLTLPTN